MTDHTCVSTLGGTRCDICFAEIPKTLRPELKPEQLLKLAREVAMDILELPAILKGFSLTEEQYAVIETNSFFQRALEAYRIEWNSALSTRDRIRVQSATALENALPSIGARMTKETESLDAQVKAGSLLAKLAGVEDQRQEGGGEKFTITINLGADTKLQYEKSVAPKAPASEGPAALRQLVEGEANVSAVRQLTQTGGNPTPV